MNLRAVVLSLSLAACVPKCPLPEPTHVLHGDLAFNEFERAEIELALSNWSTFSDHYVSYVVTWDGDLRGETITRIDVWDPRLAERQARGTPGHYILGWQNDRRMYLVPGLINPTSVHRVMQHELGHQIGLPHADHRSVMYADFTETEFTDVDKNLCRRFRRCP